MRITQILLPTLMDPRLLALTQQMAEATEQLEAYKDAAQRLEGEVCGLRRELQRRDASAGAPEEAALLQEAVASTTRLIGQLARQQGLNARLRDALDEVEDEYARYRRDKESAAEMLSAAVLGLRGQLEVARRDGGREGGREGGGPARPDAAAEAYRYLEADNNSLRLCVQQYEAEIGGLNDQVRALNLTIFKFKNDFEVQRTENTLLKAARAKYEEMCAQSADRVRLLERELFDAQMGRIRGSTEPTSQPDSRAAAQPPAPLSSGTRSEPELAAKVAAEAARASDISVSQLESRPLPGQRPGEADVGSTDSGIPSVPGAALQGAGPCDAARSDTSPRSGVDGPQSAATLRHTVLELGRQNKHLAGLVDELRQDICKKDEALDYNRRLIKTGGSLADAERQAFRQQLADLRAELADAQRIARAGSADDAAYSGLQAKYRDALQQGEDEARRAVQLSAALEKAKTRLSYVQGDRERMRTRLNSLVAYARALRKAVDNASRVLNNEQDKTTMLSEEIDYMRLCLGRVLRIRTNLSPSPRSELPESARDRASDPLWPEADNDRPGMDVSVGVCTGRDRDMGSCASTDASLDPLARDADTGTGTGSVRRTVPPRAEALAPDRHISPLRDNFCKQDGLVEGRFDALPADPRPPRSFVVIPPRSPRPQDAAEKHSVSDIMRAEITAASEPYDSGYFEQVLLPTHESAGRWSVSPDAADSAHVLRPSALPAERAPLPQRPQQQPLASNKEEHMVVDPSSDNADPASANERYPEEVIRVSTRAGDAFQTDVTITSGRRPHTPPGASPKLVMPHTVLPEVLPTEKPPAKRELSSPEERMPNQADEETAIFTEPAEVLHKSPSHHSESNGASEVSLPQDDESDSNEQVLPKDQAEVAHPTPASAQETVEQQPSHEPGEHTAASPPAADAPVSPVLKSSEESDDDMWNIDLPDPEMAAVASSPAKAAKKLEPQEPGAPNSHVPADEFGDLDDIDLSDFTYDTADDKKPTQHSPKPGAGPNAPAHRKIQQIQPTVSEPSDVVSLDNDSLSDLKHQTPSNGGLDIRDSATLPKSRPESQVLPTPPPPSQLADMNDLSFDMDEFDFDL